MKNLILLLSASLLFASCAMKQKVMDVSVVSMTQTHLPPAAKLQEKGPVSSTFCSDAMHDKGNIGLFDEAIKSAQTQNSVDFITNVSFWKDEKGCILLEGTGQKIVADASSTMEDTAATTTDDAHAKKKSGKKSMKK